MESLRNIIADIRIFMYGGVATLPLSLAGTLSILGLFTANYAILFFLLGYLILVPLIMLALSYFPIFQAKSTDICKLVIPYSTRISNTTTSTQGGTSLSWVAMIAFFIGYIFTNAIELYNRESQDTTINVTSTAAPDINSKVTNRKSQAIVAMLSIIIFGLIVFGFRFYTGCESIWQIGLTVVAFIFAGNGWYQALSKIGQDRLSDIFGIANRLLPPSAINNAPIACVPIPS